MIEKTYGGHKDRWRHMIDRCYNPECKAYPDYGGRGISVCPEWRTLGGFLADLPDGHFDGAEIDRIDNNGNYEPGNVRWSTRQENTRNRRSNCMLTHDCRTQTMTAWAEEIGVAPQVIWSRLNTWKWSVERALTDASLSDPFERMKKAHETRWAGHVKAPRPEKRILKRFMFHGEMRTINEISDTTGIPVPLLRKRLCERGWPIEKATQP